MLTRNFLRDLIFGTIRSKSHVELLSRWAALCFPSGGTRLSTHHCYEKYVKLCHLLFHPPTKGCGEYLPYFGEQMSPFSLHPVSAGLTLIVSWAFILRTRKLLEVPEGSEAVGTYETGHTRPLDPAPKDNTETSAAQRKHPALQPPHYPVKAQGPKADAHLHTWPFPSLGKVKIKPLLSALSFLCEFFHIRVTDHPSSYISASVKVSFSI